LHGAISEIQLCIIKTDSSTVKRWVWNWSTRTLSILF